MLGVRRIVAWLLTFMLMAASYCARAEGSPIRVDVDLAYHCLWWSEAQMEHFNPNSPPPKATDVKIDKWEYSDPVGVPHPDSVDIVATLHNPGPVALGALVVEVAGTWKVGARGSARKASWEKATVLKSLKVDSLASGETVTFRVPVDLAARMTALGKRKMWPWALRTSLSVTGSGTTSQVVKRELVLPIQPGD